MNDLNIEELLQNSGDGVAILPTLFAFFICLVMAFMLRKFYEQRSFSLTGKSHISSILPILSAVVFIVIVVVKSSLALSLGLVGALSIVRFRTPIKEPEELVYLFLAIAIGLGYGAGHVLITTLLITIAMAVIYFWLSNNNDSKINEYNFVISWANSGITFESIMEVINKYADATRLVRLDQNSEKNMAVLLLSPNENFAFEKFLGEVRLIDPELSVTFYEAETSW